MRTTDREPPSVARTAPLPHQPALDHARKVGAWAVRALALPETQRRASPALALHDQVVEHHVGVVTLAERQVFGAMITLLRPMLDRHLRALWVERVPSPDAVARFLASDDAPDTDTLLRLLRKADRLGDANGLLQAWEASPLHHHPALAPPADIARTNANVQFVPTLADVVDTLTYSTGLALLSTMRMAELVGDTAVLQSARFRYGVLAGVGGG